MTPLIDLLGCVEPLQATDVVYKIKVVSPMNSKRFLVADLLNQKELTLDHCAKLAYK
jgi:hypothetical protein